MDLSSNEYYGGINRRFDRRSKLLRKLGYTYTTTQYGAMFTRGNYHQIKSIAASLVLVASNFDFNATLRQPITCKKDT
jgi:hypothetical protein